jgi:hypothetical protein
MYPFDGIVAKPFDENIDKIREFLSHKSSSENKNFKFIDNNFNLKDLNKNFKNIIKDEKSALYTSLQQRLGTDSIHTIKELVVSQRIKVSRLNLKCVLRLKLIH